MYIQTNYLAFLYPHLSNKVPNTSELSGHWFEKDKLSFRGRNFTKPKLEAKLNHCKDRWNQAQIKTSEMEK